MTDGSILLVRHGRSRGRMPGYLDQCLHALARTHGVLRRRIRLHHTGERMPELRDARALVFWLADPLRERYPECYAEAVRLAEEARRTGVRIVNPPEALSHSIKSVQARLWSDAGLPTPEQRRFESRRELEAVVDTMDFPVLVRADELHAQEAMRLCRRPGDVRELADAALSLPGAVTPFVDVRAEFRRRGAAGPLADFFHKRRVFVFGDVVQTTHLYFSEQPIVSRRTSTLLAYKKLRHRGPAALRRARRRYQPGIDADMAYAAQRDEHADLMRRATRALGLDFVAIDYATRPDGSVVLWEANPYFSLPRWYRNLLPVKRRLWRRHARFHEAIATFFETLLA